MGGTGALNGGMSALRPLRLEIEELVGLDILEGNSGTGVRGSTLCRGELDSAKVDGVTTDVEEEVDIKREAKEDWFVEDRGRRDVGDSARNEEGVKAPDDSSVTDNVEGGGVTDGTDSGNGGRGSGGRGGDVEETDAEETDAEYFDDTEGGRGG